VKKRITPAIKAHFIRGAFYLLLLLAVFVIPVALGQRSAINSAIDAAKMSFAVGLSSTSGAAQPHHSISPPREFTPVTLWQQYDNAGTAVTLSATFTDFPDLNSDLADDFVVPVGQSWLVEWIDVDGAYVSGQGPANSFNVFFYYDNGGFPGMQVYARTDLGSWTQNGSTFTITLPECCPAQLGTGTFWVEVQANMTGMCCGEWGWTDRTVTSVNAAVWQNPSNVFGYCQSWSRRGATCGLDPSAPDQVYQLRGHAIFEPTPTPTVTPTATPCASVGSWTEQAPYPIAVSGHAVVSQGGNVYSFGGIVNNAAITTAYKYSPATNTWTPISPLPAPRGWFSGASDDTYIYLLGGVDQNFNTTATLWRYDPASDTYNTSLPSYTIPTYFHASVYLNGKIYRIAGAAIGTDFHVEVYDIATNSWSMAANYPFANHNLMAAALGGYIYAGGGNASPDKTYRYDPNTDTWDDAAVADLPAGRSSAASDVYNGRWILAGGDVNFTTSNSVIAWDPATNTWSTLPNMVQARDNLEGATAGQSFYALAGDFGPGNPTNDNQQYTEPPCATPTPTSTPTPTPTPTATATATATPIGTATPTPTPTFTPRPTPTPRPRPTPPPRP